MKKKGAHKKMDEKTGRKADTKTKGKVNLLIVDDETEFLNSIGRRLSVRGFNIFTADCGEKALECAQNNPIDIAVVDLKMPGIDGETTLKRLKSQHKWMEIIILTGHGSVASAVGCIESGAYSYLEKPCEMGKLLEVLAKAYKKKIMNVNKLESDQMEELKRFFSIYDNLIG
jgi:DNA-binding NtrC family response regulator